MWGSDIKHFHSRETLPSTTSHWSRTFGGNIKVRWNAFMCEGIKGNPNRRVDIEPFCFVKSSQTLFLFLQLVKFTSYNLKEWAASQWSCSSAVSTVTLPNRTHKSLRLITAESLLVCFHAMKHSPHVVSVPQSSQLQRKFSQPVTLFKSQSHTFDRYEWHLSVCESQPGFCFLALLLETPESTLLPSSE